jgi:hypothetical protein
MLQDLEDDCFQAEFFDDALGHDGADALNKTGPQIFLNSGLPSRAKGIIMYHLELLIILGMIGPFSLNLRLATSGPFWFDQFQTHITYKVNILPQKVQGMTAGTGGRADKIAISK